MHYLYTTNLLLAFSVLISWKQFGGSPIECMFPNKFPGSWEEVDELFKRNFCFQIIKRTEEEVRREREEKNEIAVFVLEKNFKINSKYSKPKFIQIIKTVEMEKLF